MLRPACSAFGKSPVLPAHAPVEREEVDRRVVHAGPDAGHVQLLHDVGAPHRHAAPPGRMTWNMCQLLSVKFADGQADPEGPDRGTVEFLEVGAGELAALRREFLEVRQLAEADPRGDVGHVELPACELDLHAVVARPHDALEPVLLGEPRLALVVQDEASALGGRDVLVGVEAERHEVPEGADPPPLPGAAEGLGRVLDDAKPVLPRDRVQAVAVDRKAGQVDRDDRAGPRRDRRLDASEVDVPGDGIDVDEDGPRPDLQDHVGRGDPGERGRDHLVPGPHPGDPQRDLHRAGARVEGPDGPPAEHLRKLGLERLHLRSRGDPSRAEHLRDAGDRFVVNRGPRERQERLDRPGGGCDGGRWHCGGHSAG